MGDAFPGYGRCPIPGCLDVGVQREPSVLAIVGVNVVEEVRKERNVYNGGLQPCD